MWGSKIWFCDNVGLLAKGLSPQKLIWVITVGYNEEALQFAGRDMETMVMHGVPLGKLSVSVSGHMFYQRPHSKSVLISAILLLG